MTALAANTNSPADHDPADCSVCGFHATGIGLGLASKNDKDPRWLCVECIGIIEDLRKVRRMDPYELKARAGGMNAAGPMVAEFGTDLSEWDEEQVLMFCGAIWKGCATELRRLVRMGEAPW